MPNPRHANPWDDDEPPDWENDDFDPGEDWADDADEEYDEDDDPTVPCPHCRGPVYEDTPRCPHCGRDIDEADVRPRVKPLWITLGAIACLYAAARWIFG